LRFINEVRKNEDVVFRRRCAEKKENRRENRGELHAPVITKPRTPRDSWRAFLREETQAVRRGQTTLGSLSGPMPRLSRHGPWYLRPLCLRVGRNFEVDVVWQRSEEIGWVLRVLRYLWSYYEHDTEQSIVLKSMLSWT